MTGKLGRRPYTIFEIDFPRCTRTYGVGACTASLADVDGRRNKCVNSRATCQVLSAYDPGVITHRYVMGIDGMPKASGYFPMLESVTTRPPEINLSGIDPRSTAMGVRGGGTATLGNARDPGGWTDPYAAERRSGAAQWSGVGFLPEQSGTHWGKLLAAQPYYQGLPCRVRRGYVGDAIEAMSVEHYVISEITGPDASGKVKVIFRDLLSLAEGDKALAPAQSRGKLTAALTASATSATLTPAGVGADYPASGLVRIGREIAAYTRADDVLTFTERGAEGTTAASHKALDVVQTCLVVDPARACDVGALLLRDYAGLTEAQTPLATWQATHDSWLAGMLTSRTIISKPTAVTQLLGELSQIGVVFYPDVPAGVVQYRIHSPLNIGETYYEVDDAAHLIEGSVSIERGEDQRLSALLLFHGVLDWTGSMTDPDNFAKVAVAQVGDDPYEQASIQEMTTRWYGQEGNTAQANLVVERLLTRYAKPPKIITGGLDVSDAAEVTLAARIKVATYLVEDFLGSGDPELMQVNYVERTGDDRLKFRAETYDLDGRFGYIMPPEALGLHYDDATPEQRATGCFMVDDAETDTFSDGSGPYLIF